MKNIQQPSSSDNKKLQVAPIDENDGVKWNFSDSSIMQFFIFKGEDYLGWDCFNKDTISIGKGNDADIKLSELNILDTAAIIHFKGGHLIASEGMEGRGVLVNGKLISTCMLEPLDCLNIGPYTLKIKIKQINKPITNLITKDEGLNRIISNADLGEKLKSLGNRILSSNEEQYSILTYNKKTKKNVDNNASFDNFDNIEVTYKNIETEKAKENEAISKSKEKLDKNREICDKASKMNNNGAKEELEDNTKYTPNKPKPEEEKEKQAEISIKNIYDDAKLQNKTQNRSHTIQDNLINFEYDEDEEDDDEKEDISNLFSIREKLIFSNNIDSHNAKDNLVFEIIKCQGNNIIDIKFLSKGDKYYSKIDDCKFCLAEYDNSQKPYFYFNNRLNITALSGETTGLNTSKLCIPDNLFNKRKKIYRDLLPKDETLSINDGCYDYFLCMTKEAKSPNITLPQNKDKSCFKNLGKSVVFHLVILLFLSLFASLPDISHPPELQKPRFVKIETQKIENMKQKAEKPPEKPKIEKVISKTDKPAPKPINKPKEKVSSKPKKIVKATTSRHPKAGGGSGKAGGNILNRNVKQAGLLSMLGTKSGVNIGPKEVIAAVTNLDAVLSTHGSESNFKVAAAVGKLGNGRIEAPTVGFVNTKGSTQVLRSAGVEGKGSIAALEVGRTGQNQVMAMVSAELSKKVRVLGGGMSREAVKKVIDKHLDEITYCYETALVTNPSLMGKVVFEWKILTSGKVGEIKINFSSIQSDSIHSCIKSKIKSWQFPKPIGTSVVVSYPFIFDLVGF